MNMDIKDLIAKLKGGNSGAKRGGGITGFFEKNPKMKIIIPAICLGLSVLVAIVIIVTTGTIEIDESPVGGNSAGSQVDVLPQDVRDLEDIEVLGDDVFDDVALANAKVTAIIKNSEGYYTATVEADKQSYPHLQVGDYVGASSWLVEDITDECVIVALGEKKIQLTY
ncbi:MAG: hypothetical protein IKU41_05920 [Clostridia bacterium]|nr:hypothetical protein [Clostridia bacterium]